MKILNPIHLLLPLLLLEMAARTFCQELKVLTTTDDMAAWLGSTGYGARLENEQEIDLKDLSVCLRFFDFIKLQGNVLISATSTGGGRLFFLAEFFAGKNHAFSYGLRERRW